jgi:hypothetical protein
MIAHAVGRLLVTSPSPCIEPEQTGAAVDWIDSMHPGSASIVTLYGAVKLTYRAILELLAEPYFGRFEDPAAFRLPVGAIARRVRDIRRCDSGSEPNGDFVDPNAIEVILDALIVAGVLVELAPGDPYARTPR